MEKWEKETDSQGGRYREKERQRYRGRERGSVVWGLRYIRHWVELPDIVQTTIVFKTQGSAIRQWDKGSQYTVLPNLSPYNYTVLPNTSPSHSVILSNLNLYHNKMQFFAKSQYYLTQYCQISFPRTVKVQSNIRLYHNKLSSSKPLSLPKYCIAKSQSLPQDSIVKSHSLLQ